jgi:hypothetical protein
MKKIFTSPNVAEVGLLASLLEDEGFACFVKNQHLAMASGSIPFLECWPEIWVNDSDFEGASTLIAEWQGGAAGDAD